MKITTKYSLKDKVWYMSQNRPHCSEVTHVYIRITGKDQCSISYHIGHGDTEWTDDMLFSSKTELLNSL